MLNVQTRLLVFALAVGLMPACGNDDPTIEGGFSYKDEAGESPDGEQGGDTRLTGRALTMEDEPAGDVTAYVRAEDGQVHSVQTNTDGRFSFDPAPSGPVELVLNDGRGAGALVEMILFADGENTAGDIQLRPLEAIPGIVDVHGVGFEERITTGAGNYEFPVYNSDTSKVYATRNLDGEEKWSIVEVDTATGAERVLLQDQRLRSLVGSKPSSPHWPVLDLAADRFLVFASISEADGLHYTVFDIVDEKIAFETAGIGVTPWEPVVTDGAVVVAVSLEEAYVRDNEGEYLADRVELYRFDTANRKVDRVEAIDGGWITEFDFYAFNEEVISYQVTTPCVDGGEFVGCGSIPPYETSYPATHYLIPDTMETVSLPDEDIGYGLVPSSSSEKAVYGVGKNSGSPVTITRMNLETGATKTRDLEICSQCDPNFSYRLRVGADSNPILVEVKTDNPQLSLWDFETDTTAEIDLTVDVDGQTFSLCNGDRCAFKYGDDGIVRARRSFERTPGDWWLVMIDFDGTGQEVERRLIDIGEEDGQPGDYDSTVVESPAGDAEAMRIRHTDTGFFQYSLARNGHPPTQRTFLPAHHGHAAFSTDGSTLFYFTRDPISGYEQLFRLGVFSLPVLW